MNLVELSDQNYKEFGEVVSVYYNDEPYTNVQLRNSANSLAN